MKKLMKIVPISAFFIAATLSNSFAGHHCGMGMDLNNLENLDKNNDNEITFEEFSEGNNDRLKKIYQMLDTDNDSVINEKELGYFLDVHGLSGKKISEQF